MRSRSKPLRIASPHGSPVLVRQAAPSLAKLVVLLCMLAFAIRGEVVESAESPSTSAPAGAELPAEAGDSLLDGLARLPLHDPDQDSTRDQASIRYFTATSIDEVWAHYERELRQRGWTAIETGAYHSDSGRQASYRRGQAHIHVGVWMGNARDPRHATRVDINHLGSVVVDQLPRIEAVEDSIHCFPQTCVYRSRHAHSGLLQAIIEALQTEGWEIVPLPADTQRSPDYVDRIAELRGHGSRLDISLGPPPAEAAEGQPSETPVQYSVRLESE